MVSYGEITVCCSSPSLRGDLFISPRFTHIHPQSYFSFYMYSHSLPRRHRVGNSVNGNHCLKQTFRIFPVFSLPFLIKTATSNDYCSSTKLSHCSAIRLCCTSPATKTTSSLTVVPVWDLQKVKCNIIWKINLVTLLLLVFSPLLLPEKPRILLSTSYMISAHSKQQPQRCYIISHRSNKA